MPKKAQSHRTAPIIISDIIKCGMIIRQESLSSLGKKVHVCENTVRNNLNNPESMTVERMFIYFAALGIPTEDVLQGISNSLADEIAGK